MSILSPMQAIGTIALDSDGNRAPPISRLGYARTGASTADFLERIAVDGDEIMADDPRISLASGHRDLWGRYMPLIKQLPTRRCIEKLAEFYFHNINWQYYALDERSFRQQLHSWYESDLQASTAEKFEALPADMKAFPALLFEIIATSLLLMTPSTAVELDDFRHMDSMAFETMAVEYSETGMAILGLLGKRQVTLTTVFADFLRVAFLKYYGQVTDAVSLTNILL